MKEAIVPAIYNRDLLDEVVVIDTEEAFETARQITRKEGIFVGMSSGAAMLAALEIAKKIDSENHNGKIINIVTIFPDRGEKYLSTGLFK